MDDDGRTTRRIRTTIDRPGLHLNLAADVNVVVSHGGTSTSSQHMHVRQERSARTGPDTDHEETP